MPPDWEMGVSGQHQRLIAERMAVQDMLPPAHRALLQQHDPFYVKRVLAAGCSFEEAAAALEAWRNERQAARWERHGGTLPEEHKRGL